MSTEASGGSWLNHADGNQAAPGCGLMLSPRLPKLSCLTVFPGQLKVFKGQLAFPNNSVECEAHTFFSPKCQQTQSLQNSSKDFSKFGLLYLAPYLNPKDIS